METIDLRSDTLTLPSVDMRQAMAEAEVGDDVWGEDPTVIRLQQWVAEMLDMEAALYVPSGTMANQIALKVHTRPGDSFLVGWGSHCITYEGGASVAIAGAHHRVLGQGGLFTVDDVTEALEPPNIHRPPTTLVWLENTHNRGGGKVFPPRQVQAIANLAHREGMAVHLDGARLLNTAAATGLSPAELVAQVDSTSICLSKGLGAPVGSVLAGSAAFIKQALRFRKMLGGGMRQVGILAAAGLYALRNNVKRLPDDHKNARLLAEGLARLPGLDVDLSAAQTNIVIWTVDDAAEFCARCADMGVLFSQMDRHRVRAVTHLDVDRHGCQEALRRVTKLAQHMFE